MVEFLLTSRKTVGVLILILAACVSILWIRTGFTFDSLKFTVGEEHHELWSKRDVGIVWETWKLQNNQPVSVRYTDIQHSIAVVLLTMLGLTLVFPQRRRPTTVSTTSTQPSLPPKSEKS